MHRANENKLAASINEYLGRRAPGFLVVLNAASQRAYGVPYGILLIRSPSAAYKLLRELYGSRASFAAKLLIAIPLARLSGVPVNKILELLEKGDDAAILGPLGLAPRLAEGVAGVKLEQELFREVLSCVIEIEKLAASVYSELAKHFDEPFSSALNYIAAESSIHAMIYTNMYRAVFGNHLAVCGRSSSTWFIDRLRQILEALKGGISDRAKLVEIFKFLAGMESDIDAEYFMELVSPLLATILQEPYKSVYGPLLEAIARDEENHRRLVTSMINVLGK